MRCLLLTTLCLMAGSVPGQVQEKLRASKPSEVAWGAHLAAEQGLKKLIPDLRKALLRMGDLPGHGFEREVQQMSVRLSLLDSLIRLGADVPSDELAPFFENLALYEHGPLLAPALVLAARNPKRHESLLVDVMREASGEAWLAVGNLLVSSRSEELVPRLLRGLYVSVRIRLFDKKRFDVEPIGRFSWGCGRPRLRWFWPPKGYPPLHYYYLRLKQVPKAQLLADGKRRVYLRRVFNGSGRYVIQRPSSPDYPKQRLEWIAELLGVKADQLPFPSKVVVDMSWQDAQTYEHKIAREHRKALGAFHSLVNRLVLAGLADKKELADLKPEISILVLDCRSRALADLPELDGVAVARYPREDFGGEDTVEGEETAKKKKGKH